MEEEIKEVVKTEDCCKKNGKFMKYHHLCGHKVIKDVLVGLLMFLIFALGVSVGSHLNRDQEDRQFRQFTNEGQRDGMMFNRLRGQVNQNQFYGPMRGQIEIQSQATQDGWVTQGVQAMPSDTFQVVSPAPVATPVKTVVPVK